MELALSQRDHPSAVVNAHGIQVGDPYFQACWGPLLSPWAAHVVTTAAELTGQGPRRISFDEYCAALNPEPAERALRSKIVFGAMVEAQRAGLGTCTWPAPHQGTLVVHRHVPLLTEHQLLRLSDPALFAHVGVVAEVNERLVEAGAPSEPVPGWVADRIRQADPTARPLDPAAARAVQEALARLDSLSRGPDASAVPAPGRPNPAVLRGPSADGGLSL